MVLPILIWPDKVLAAKARLVADFDATLKSLAQDMIDTMRAQKGWGLAAPQVGKSIALFVADATASVDGGAEPMIFVNPKIIAREGKQTFVEGCLSLPDVQVKVSRARHVKVAAFDLNNQPFTVEAEGPGAVVLQHEFDHLEGKTIADGAAFGVQKAIRAAMLKVKKAGGKA